MPQTHYGTMFSLAPPVHQVLQRYPWVGVINVHQAQEPDTQNSMNKVTSPFSAANRVRRKRGADGILITNLALETHNQLTASYAWDKLR